MKRPMGITTVWILVCILILIDPCSVLCGMKYNPPASSRKEVGLNGNWKFYKGDVAGAEQAGFDDSDWISLNIPHTWNAIDGSDGGDDYYRGICWYRKHFRPDGSDSGRRFFLQFDGANLVTDAYVNEIHAGTHKGGYSRFRFDITSMIHPGLDNVVAVKVNNAINPDVPTLSGDWTRFGGLYRNVSLLITDALHVDVLDYAGPGVYLKQTNVSESSADLEIMTRLVNQNPSEKSITLRVVIVDSLSRIVEELENERKVNGNSDWNVLQKTSLRNPHLWNGTSDPYQYTVYVEVAENRKVKDLVSQPLGLRFFHVDPDKGFYLNGKPLALHGVCRHQDRMDKGWAISEADQVEDMRIISEMGVNAVRASHYQQSQHWYSLCDQSGMTVWAELGLVNLITNSETFFANAKQQMIELIRQNYNHPSILFWSLGNEIWSDETVAANLFRELNGLANAEDSTRLTTFATNINISPNWIPDLLGWNEYFGWYYDNMSDFGTWVDSLHAVHPQTRLCISEYGAGASVRHHEENPQKPKTDGPWHPEEYQNQFHEETWKQICTRSYFWGSFIWNMFDFASDGRNEGDHPGMNDKGLVTYDRKVKKDAYFFYKATWTNTPVVYITSRRYTSRTTAPVDVKVYSNFDSVELKLNGISQGKRTGEDRIFKWKGIGLIAGKNSIEAVGFKGKKIYRDRCLWERIESTSTGLKK
jgi:beta-galactosidase